MENKKTLSSRYKKLNNKNIFYIDSGQGDPILLLHGNPTSSYLWRNIIPILNNYGRCLAPDLIGMGKSDKLDNTSDSSYSFLEHRRWLDLFLDYILNETKVILVLHDWGSALGFDWAKRNKEKVKGIVYMEGIVCPLEWSDWPINATKVFKALRTSDGEEMILEKNFFVEKILPSSIIRTLEKHEMDAYRKPFALSGEDRRPTLTWPRQIPLQGDPPEVNDIVSEYSKWLSFSDIPKLFINAEPGSILVGRQREFCRKWPNQKEVTVKGIHFIQEDSPLEIGKAILEWSKEVF